MTKKQIDKEPVKNHLRKLRKALGLTLEGFGKPLNRTRDQIFKHEKGENITVRLLLDIKRTYGFSFEDMLGEDEENASIKSEISLLKNAVSMLMDIQERAFKEKLPKINVERD